MALIRKLQRLQETVKGASCRLPPLLAFRYVVLEILNVLILRTRQAHFAAYAEDIVIRNHFGNKKTGHYVDVGCNHPIRSSNTFLLYLNGWQGLCIDANQELIDLHRHLRPRDKQRHAAITEASGTVTFYPSVDDSLGTISPDFRDQQLSRYQYLPGIQVEELNLTEAIIEAFGAPPQIDLLDIDVEGHDIEVLRSLDFNIIRPALISVENLEKKNASDRTDIDIFLEEKGYTLRYITNTNSFYVDDRGNK